MMRTPEIRSAFAFDPHIKEQESHIVLSLVKGNTLDLRIRATQQIILFPMANT